MAGRLLFEFFVFSIPFVLFGIYLLATASAEEEGRRKWPIQILFLCGLGLATAAWLVLILMEKKERDVCHEPARFENGKIIPARDYPCEQNVKDVGVPLRRDPGVVPKGVEGPVDARDPSDIQARYPETEASGSSDDPD
ncbi:DUF6111 family protein [Hyphomonas johnsonii]|uniref:Uncharacterized protein n=1 Tax=Hyphomonas johnsonii MHS-2 TaxID=1280950 RepID=A0A059FJB6_9PROT|nr:DUF6111 family protein [Hyphomonas johnsonii]KCZ90621.1 hypothetical protein HJO_12256 [Hyphomonas johnsonii MHS-2]